MHPIAAQQHHLPLTRLIAEVCGDDGEHKGYAFAELLPGARNELDRINLKMYYEKLHRPEKTIISAAVEDDQTNTTVLQTDDEVQLKNEEDSMTQIVELDAEPELMSLPDNSFNESENIIDRSAENEGIDA